MVTEVGKATSEQVREVLNLLVSGVTSDVSSMEEIAGSWWRKFLFMRWFGPRFLSKQMDTFVASEGAAINGFVIVQYDGDAAGTFDWAFTKPLHVEENREEFADLVDTALDFVEEMGIHPYFYFGFATASAKEVREVLEELGLGAADYQNAQMTGDLPLAEGSALPEGMRVTAQISSRFGPKMSEFLAAVYPDAEDEEKEMIASIHTSTLRSSKVFLIVEEGDEIGFVQQFRWRDELRLLIALPPKHWGTDTERQLVSYLARTLQGKTRRLRLRTFSSAHLERARQSLEGLGLAWQEAPWQRWVVALEGEGKTSDAAEQEPTSRDKNSVWPPDVSHAAQSGDTAAIEQADEDEESNENRGNEQPL